MTSSDCNALVGWACSQDPQRTTKPVCMRAVVCAIVCTVVEVQKFDTPKCMKLLRHSPQQHTRMEAQQSGERQIAHSLAQFLDEPQRYVQLRYFLHGITHREL
jgi:hypothetical protein